MLTLKCPHCFVPLILRDRTLVNRRTVCPKCDELMHLAADPDRVVVGILPSRHNAHALTVHGVLDFPEDAPVDPHAVSTIAAPARVERTLEEVLARTPPVEPRRPLKAVDFPIDEPVELTEIAKGAAVRNAPRTGKPAQKKRPVAPPTAEARTPSALKPVAVPRPVVDAKPEAQAVASNQAPPKKLSWQARLQGAVEEKSWLAWVRQNRMLVLVAGVLVLLLIFQLIWMFRGSSNDDTAATPASTSNDPVQGSQPPETIADGRKKDSSDNGAVEVEGSGAAAPKDFRKKDSDPLAEVLPATAGNSDGDVSGLNGAPDAGLSRPAAPAVAEVPGETPATIVVSPEKPKRDPIDVAARLRQPLASFDQARPATARSLFEALEEMIGVPVLLDVKDLGQSAAALDQKVTFKLKSTTVGDVLQAVADRAGLQWKIEGEAIRMRAKPLP